MGGKSSHYLQADRPEAGGADKDMLREKSGLLDRDKEKFAVEQQAKLEAGPENVTEQPGRQAAFSIDNEPNNVPKQKSRDE
jgi:hypothetical protein